ncbi:MAG: hypothetical protein JXA90_17025 [Planctomycetes bacterium]|nr:hypothetical protein [Planctomycetota bacterium]
MDKLKENAFALSLTGVGIVILALAFFLIYTPLAALGRQERELADLRKKLTKFAEAELTPCTKTLKYHERNLMETQGELAESLQYVETRLGRFNEYFDNVREQPDLGVFFSRYEDEIRRLVERYRTRFGITAADAEAVAKLMPKVDVRVQNDRSDPAGSVVNIPLAMKEYWVIEAIFEACEALELGGLQEISLPQRVDERSSRTAAAASRREEAAKGYFTTSVFEASVKIEMPFSKLGDFLSRLYGDVRVPVVGVSSMRFVKTEEWLAKYQPLRIDVELDKEGKPVTEEEAKKKTIFDVEPPVNFDISLQVISWEGKQETPETPE